MVGMQEAPMPKKHNQPDQPDKPAVTPATIGNEDAAHYLGISPSTLATWRSTREVDVPYVRLGRCIRYRRADLDAFLAANIAAVRG